MKITVRKPPTAEAEAPPQRRQRVLQNNAEEVQYEGTGATFRAYVGMSDLPIWTLNDIAKYLLAPWGWRTLDEHKRIFLQLFGMSPRNPKITVWELRQAIYYEMEYRRRRMTDTAIDPAFDERHRIAVNHAHFSLEATHTDTRPFLFSQEGNLRTAEGVVAQSVKFGCGHNWVMGGTLQEHRLYETMACPACAPGGRVQLARDMYEAQMRAEGRPVKSAGENDQGGSEMGLKVAKKAVATAPVNPAPEPTPAPTGKRGRKAAAPAPAPVSTPAPAGTAPTPAPQKRKRGGEGGQRYTGKTTNLSKTDYFIKSLVDNEKPKNRITDEELKKAWDAEFPPDCKYGVSMIRAQFNRRGGVFTKVAQLHPDVTSHAYDEKKKQIVPKSE